jgi:hypothetical protein
MHALTTGTSEIRHARTAFLIIPERKFLKIKEIPPRTCVIEGPICYRLIYKIMNERLAVPEKLDKKIISPLYSKTQWLNNSRKLKLNNPRH